jgi:hypothetical protein
MSERWSQLGFHIGLEDLPVHRTVNDPRSGQAVMAQSGNERLGSPVAKGGLHLEPLPPPRPTSQPCHFGGRAGLVDKHQPFRALLHPRLTVLLPHPPRPNYISAFGFVRQQRFF